MATRTEHRIAARFDERKAKGQPALIAYVTAGDPSPEHTPRLIAALERGGADLIELGVPFSDPIADGPVIQRASDRALHAGTTLERVLKIAREVRETSDIPLVLFTYLNPAMRFGLDRLAADAVSAGIDGCLLTDLSVEEAERYIDVMQRHGLERIFLAAPTSTPQRLRLVAKYSSGFIYLVSRTGITGEQTSVSAAVRPLVAAVRDISSLPLAVGFGISTPEQAAEVGSIADGVVVGSAFVRLIEQNSGSPDLEAKLESFTRSLRTALDEVKRQ
ncbi:MAG TPA: tryptophan synthase subunit alpha [Bryobacteraceae bacterium]|nr:tryptophan synthase subunit alpha [Bryobacteraceae bacterium]